MDDLELEQVMRDGLHRRAEDVDTTFPVLARVRAARRRRRAGRVVIGLAAASVIAVAATSVALSGGGGAGDASRAGDSDPLPAKWRTEYWHDTAVDVPADWAWGGSPMRQGRDLLSCWAGPMRGVDGAQNDGVEPGLAYVGRPLVLTDMCLGFDPDDQRTPDAPYVWFDAPLDPGTVELGDGWVQQTVEANGSLVTVATQDERLRKRILSTARGGETCMSELSGPPVVTSMLTEGLRNPSSATVCAYRQEEDASPWELVYATVLDAEQATVYHAQVYDGGREWTPDFCDSPIGERVLVTISGDDPFGDSEVTQDTVVDPQCGEVSGAPGMVTPLGEKGMRAWSRNGAQAILSGLIGPMG